MVRVNFVTLNQAVEKLVSYGVNTTRQEIKAQGSQRVAADKGRDVVILDYRKIGKPFMVDWVFSVEDRLGREIARFNVKR